MKYDTLKVILAKYKDKVDINCKTSTNFMPFHLLCAQTNAYEKEGCKLFLQMKDLKINEQEQQYFYSPLHVAIICKNLDIALILLNDPEIDLNLRENPKTDNTKKKSSKKKAGYNSYYYNKKLKTTIFEEAMKQNLVEIINILIKKPDLKTLGEFTSYFVSYPSNNDYQYSIRNLVRTYPFDLIKFFMEKTKDKDIEKVKKEIFKENVALFTCLAARYFSVPQFVEFLDTFNADIDINAVVEDRVFFNIYILMKLHHLFRAL